MKPLPYLKTPLLKNPVIESELLTSPSLSLLVQSLKKERSILIEHLWDGPKSALLCLIAKELKRPIFVITSDKTENQLASNLEYFGVEKFLEYPAWDLFPSSGGKPSPDIVGQRLSTLFSLLENGKNSIVLAPMQSALQKVPSPSTAKPLFNFWKVGEEIPFDVLDEFLSALGYQKEAIVSDKGQYAVRQGIIDLFPLTSPAPVRIECFGDQIESIRSFDLASQLSFEKLDSIFLPPACETKLLAEEKSPSSIFDYLHPDTIIIFDDLLTLEDRYVNLLGPARTHGSHFLTIEELFKDVEKHTHCFWTKESAESLGNVHLQKRLGREFYSKTTLQPIEFECFSQKLTSKRFRSPFIPLSNFLSTSEEKGTYSKEELLLGLKTKPKCQVHFITKTPSEENTLKHKLQDHQIPLDNATFDRGYLASGFALEDSSLLLFPMTELTGQFQIRRQKLRASYHTPSSEFHQLAPGDLVVHFHNGIGKYLGVEKRTNHLGNAEEFLVIEYASQSKLFVPIASSYLVSRYIGAKEQMPTLHQLGTQKWQRAREQAQKAIVGYAQELLKQNAQRELKGGFVYPDDSHELQSFEDDFPFVETDDQIEAIKSIKEDMRSKKAMDRLICGDVGYGKTEVAMRAAFKAVVDGGKQVAILVPTTILAMQHYETFCQRMSNYPITIGVVSRFIGTKTCRENLEKARKGSLDILIGTHRIISKDVAFDNLGLIIIDEEQRFGVRAKEHLKTLKTGVDCLTLSATPIPRTLYMSLVGARDVSMIKTPPQDRLPIQSRICERNQSLIQNALIRELSRDGQAFFVHNRVETIDKVAEELQTLVPQAKIVVGHGQMSADALDKVYHAFKNGDADILVATSIIENGVDIPNANTIFIDRADRFGLADLHQIRGRVGRSGRPAFAYFLVPTNQQLREIATKRLDALLEGAGGMRIAMRDLEIRGAGDILGLKQSGQVSTIGFHLYCKLLKKTMDTLQNQKAVHFIETRIEFSIPANLPQSYIPESSLRMELYHRLGEAASCQDAKKVLEEMIDRFGPTPSEVLWLYHLTRIRIYAQNLSYSLIKFERFTFRTERGKKQIQKQTYPLPKTKDPQEFEEAVCSLI